MCAVFPATLESWEVNPIYAPLCGPNIGFTLAVLSFRAAGSEWQLANCSGRLLLLVGWRVIRVTWAQLYDRGEADGSKRDLRRALSAPTV